MKIVTDLLRMRRTHLHALSTGDACILDDARFGVYDPDCLDRTVPHALVAVLAFILYRIDRR